MIYISNYTRSSILTKKEEKKKLNFHPHQKIVPLSLYKYTAV